MEGERIEYIEKNGGPILIQNREAFFKQIQKPEIVRELRIDSFLILLLYGTAFPRIFTWMDRFLPRPLVSLRKGIG
ncbi:hypothetical protein LEP1GSC168_0865 [Leptospira santarosai str. HAI134]|nr:hypothetical protein LEP1GSC168_0865 [Leptospira santarosai str. HAI134]